MLADMKAHYIFDSASPHFLRIAQERVREATGASVEVKATGDPARGTFIVSSTETSKLEAAKTLLAMSPYSIFRPAGEATP